MPQSRPPSRTNLWICLALLAATFAAYFQARTFDFVNYDDPDYVTRNAHVRQGITPEGLEWALTSGDAANWFPVTRVSHMLDIQLFGLDAGAQHMMNVLIHALAALALFAFLNLATGARWPSAFVAMIFALHPLHVESVAWISERKDVLCAFFWFVSLWAWVRYTLRPSRSRYLLALGVFCLGLMSKPMIVTLPVLLLLFDVWPLKRTRRIREKLPFFLLAAASGVVTLVVQKSAGAVEAFATVPLSTRLENAVLACGHYLSDTFWPHGLAVFYPYPAELPASQVTFALVVLLGVSAAAWLTFRRHPYMAVGWLWFLVTLLPVIGLVQVGSQERADRYMYVPMVGLMVMLAWGAGELVRRRPATRIAIVAMAAAVCAACLPLTWAQSANWHDSESLYRHTLAVAPGNVLAEHNLGSYLLDQSGRLPEALAHLETARRINPGSPSIRSDLATALAKSGRPQDAIPEYQAALRVDANSAIIHNNLGNALQQSGHNAEAIAEYNAALRLDPAYTDARNNLALAQQAPDPAEAHYRAGIDLSGAGRPAEAAAEFEASLRLRPGNAEAQNNLGVVLTQIPARAAEALGHFQKAVQLDPSYADARVNLGIALSQVPGGIPRAIQELETAYRLHPDPQIREALDRLRAGH